MSFIRPGAGGGGGVVIQNSCTLLASGSEHFTQTPGGAGDSDLKGCLSFWYKPRVINDTFTILGADPESSNDETIFTFHTDEQGRFEIDTGSTARWHTPDNMLVVSTWAHHHVFFDSAQATLEDRLSYWRNGVDQGFSEQSEGSPNLNEQMHWGQAVRHALGKSSRFGSDYADGQLAHVHYFDGVLPPVTDVVTFTGAAFVAHNYAGSYGSNGWRLAFDNSADMGEDSSGNGNDWTEVNVDSGNQSADLPVSPL